MQAEEDIIGFQEHHAAMFTLTEVASLNDIQPTYRILKPWWDVFMDYLGLVMLMLAIFAMTMQITKDQVACLPCLEDPEEASASKPCSFPQQSAQEASSSVATGAPVVNTVAYVTKDLPDEAVHEIHVSRQKTAVVAEEYVNQPQPTGIKTNLDFQQYVFINQICYHVALPWYSKYFPYLTLIHTIVLMVSSNFWFKYPKTSSKIEHFVSILGRCFESPWTTKALSETACEDSENKQRFTGTSSVQKQTSVEGKDENTSITSSTPMLGRTFSADKAVLEVPSSMTILDKKDGEQAKALFEKVRKFRAHVEDSDFIYKLYVAQTIVKTVKFILILSYTSTFLAEIRFTHNCKPKVEQLTGYRNFYCTHNMAFMLNKLLITYMALILIYGMTCLYSLFWVFRRPLKEYSFEKVREESSFSDIPDVKNDFAFLLHMVDQYDQLYSKRFGVFLSEVSENKLREISLNHEWTFEKLRQLVTRNAQDQQELHLFMLSGLPNAVFDLTDLEVLKLELIPEVRFSAKVSQMTCLQELHLCHCPAKVEQTGFAFLRDHLRCLHVKFTDVAEIPTWVYLLRNLRELNLIGNLSSENNKMIGIESMRDLRHLKTLCLKSNLTKIPTNITDLSPHLIKLVVHNDGTKLVVLNSLKKMTNLVDLELHNCELERIPHAIFSLATLQELDLKSNSIRTIEEIISLQHLRRLVCLKLWHNKIITISSSIGQVKSLETVYFSHNNLESLPLALFTLPKLRHLDVSHNSITVLPPDVGHLQNLQHFAISSNKLEMLPKPLFRCTKLKVLCLGQNALTTLSEAVGQLVQLTQLELKGNCLDRLPVQLGNCRLLRKNGLVVEDHLFDTLPVEVKESINRDNNTSFTNGL
ncbi:Volume-regulated anion channel subunit LRRC8D [Channa argus]|uniref:Volume-regulated anion channel subunit LRRC8D n=2 Tax=Channa argus TaxID=215402 RepID=A0A6G1Q912_CHAAH|nr:Volume-regulated anion channel subunit LRRC8D [Channa argus]